MSVDQKAIRHMQRARELLREKDLGFGRSKHLQNANKKRKTIQTGEKDITFQKQLQDCKAELE